MKLILKNILLMLVLGLGANGSDFNIQGDRKLLDVAKKMMPSTDIKKVMPTEVPNMLAVLLANEEVIYILPQQNLIFLGEIYNTNGVSITDKHIKDIGAKKVDNEPIDISPLFKVSVPVREGKGKYGFIVFTDPDCPFCKQLDQFLTQQDVTIHYVYTPIDSKHPNARAKAIKEIMTKRSMNETEAKQLIGEGEKIATGLGLNGTPLTIVYEIASKKPIQGISGAKQSEYAPYLK